MSNIKLFENKKVRSQWNEKEEQWFFSIIDVVEVLTGSPMFILMMLTTCSGDVDHLELVVL